MSTESNTLSNENCNAIRRWLGLAIAFVFVVQSVGCSVFDGMMHEPMSDYRNHVWANRAYNLRYGDCERRYSDDFRNGFLEGYCDVCNGQDGYVPATAPDHYWGYQYQSPEGAGCVNAWFEGYPLGAQAAKKDGGGAFHDVYISKMAQSAMIQQKANHVLPDDVPVVAPQGNPANNSTMRRSSMPIRQTPGGPLPFAPATSASGQPFSMGPAQQVAPPEPQAKPLPSIIQSSSFIPRDPDMSVPEWDELGGN